ncbi:MAG: FkbM family methyltransferase [Solirubrobacteraceae bacterium]
MRRSRLRKLVPRRLRRGAIALTQYPDTWRLTADWRSFREYRRLENPPRRMRDGTQAVSVRFREMPGSPLLLRPATEDDSLAQDALFRRHHLPPASLPVDEVQTIWDLGANVGLTMAHMATLFPRARIVGVELDAGNAALCRKNIAAWGNRCELIHAGVWHSDGTVEYIRDPGRAQSCHIGSGQTSASAPAISLNTLLARTGARRVDYVKMDIEGAEAQVLKQATEWAQQVRSIKVEIHDGYTVKQCVEDLQRLGFSPEPIPKHRGGVVGIRP